jgi:CheY-like chemotaxis protein
VAKVLVADDNSNIQKMVGLALKDHGIDVVAVGNGEAAVRKISDVRPDLVLADVFMPVRNGYEVCKYVKDDSSLSHIPVILLVGAFDPLDEQEAQRVGADGVLKKPFVPPDPLISMVKSALQRASTAQAMASADKGNAAAMIGGPATSGRPVTAGGAVIGGGQSGSPNATVVIAAPTILVAPKEEPTIESESFVDEIPAKPETLNIESAGKPLAFGNLMEPPAAEDDAAYVAGPSPELADRDWNSAEEEDEEEEEEESASSSWRRDGGGEEFAPDSVNETATEKAARGKRRESWTPTREKAQDLLEETAAPEIMPSVIPAATAPQNSWGMPTQAELEVVESRPTEELVAAAVEAAPVIEPAIASVPEVSLPETAQPKDGNSWFSTSSSPWEAEAQKATQLASTWDAPAAPAASAASELVAEEPIVESKQPEAPISYDFVSEAPSDEPVHYVADPGLVGNEIVAHDPLPDLISDGSISPETVETIRQETSYALESVTENAPEKPAETSAKIAETSQQDMDALVANVLAKMSPEMLQAVTREILKPVVAAMIRDEINPKKS